MLNLEGSIPFDLDYWAGETAPAPGRAAFLPPVLEPEDHEPNPQF